MLSFLDDTPVETPCLDFFRKMPNTAFGLEKTDKSILRALGLARPCTYGDRKTDPEKWFLSMGMEDVCARLLHEVLNIYLDGRNAVPEACSQGFKNAIIHQIDAETRGGKMNDFIAKVHSDFISRKLELAFQQKPEVVMEHFPNALFMYRVKNAPTPFRKYNDCGIYDCGVMTTEEMAEKYFSGIFSQIAQMRFTGYGSIPENLSLGLVQRVNDVLDKAPCSKVPFATSITKQQHARMTQMRAKESVNTLGS